MGNKANKKASATQAQGADKAAELQAKAAERQAQLQWDMFNQSRTDNEPFRQAGLTGMSEYMALLGLPTNTVQSAAANSYAPSSSGPMEWFDPNDENPHAEWGRYNSDPAYRQAWDEVWQFHGGNLGPGSDRGQLTGHLQRLYDQNRATASAQAPAATGMPAASMTQAQAFDKFRSNPGYQFGLAEGVRALDSSAASQGGLFSGKAAKALTRFGTDYADQQGFTPYANRLASLAGIGQTATNQNNALGQGYAGSIGDAYMNAGNARAGGVANAANARASGIQNSANIWGQTAGQLGGLAGYMYGNRGGWGGV
jgi:hypothetical protein